MKTPDATSGVLLSEAADPGGHVQTPETTDGEARRVAAAGQAPIAVTDGDFSTPTRRTRIVTRPRGLKTLEALGLLEGSSSAAIAPPPDAEPTPAPAGDDARRPPADELTPPPDGWTRGTRRVSAVDEFLAALPTPVPELGPVTPPPDVPLTSFVDDEASPVSTGPRDPFVAPPYIENAASAAELRRAALAATPEPVPASTRAPSAQEQPEREPEHEPPSSQPPIGEIADPVAEPAGARDVDAHVPELAAFDPREITAIRLAQDLETDLDHQLAGRFGASSAYGHGQGDAGGPLEIEVTPFHDEVRPAETVPLTTMPSAPVSAEFGDLASQPREAEALALDPTVTHAPAQPGEPVEGGGAAVGVVAESAEAPSRSSALGPVPGGEPAAASQGTPSVPEDTSSEGAAESALSPLALTLAHMAEAMQPEFGYEATDDVEILEPPAANPAAEEAVPPARGRTNTPPPVPRHARGVTQDRSQDRGAVLPAPSRPEVPEALAERPRRPKRAKPWFEEIFDENYLRTLPFMTAQQTLREVDFLQATLNVQPGACVLDVGCGYGRHAIELVQRGLAVTGLDLSLPLLIRAADESQRRNLVVDFVHGDMRQMAFERQFDAAYSMLTSFGYFDEESNLRVAEGIARALKPGGRLLLDVVNRDYVVGDLPTRVWWEGDGCVVLEEVEFNFNTNRLLTHRSVVFDDGRQLDQEISLRAYSLHDLGKLLRLAGFRILEVSGSIFTRGHYFGASSRNLIVLAERRGD